MAGKTEQFKSTCSYCGVGCGIVVHKDKQGRIKVEGDPDHPVNKGMLCSKGMNLHYAVKHQTHRLLHPMMRWSKGHPLEKVTWDTAMKRAAAVFRSIISKHGPDSVGFYVSGQCLTEEYYLANKLAKGYIGTNNIDTNSRLCMSSAVAGYTKMLGEDAVPISYNDIELADVFMIAGANPAWCHPILYRRLEAHKQANPGVKVIAVDPRATQTCRQADLHLQINPGTDVYLYLGIARVLIEQGDIDIQFIQRHTSGYRDFKQSAMQHTLDEVSHVTGVPEADIRQAAKWIGNAKGFITMWAMGLNQSAIGVNKNIALISLNLLTGHIGKPGSGPFSLTGQPNAMGGREVGGMASLLSSHRDLHNALHRKEVASFWGVEDVPAQPGFTATQMFEALETGKLKAIWIVCTNPLVSLPDARRVEKALEKANFVVVQDISNQNLAIHYADLVLPAAGHMEKEGTMTNSERRIGHLEKVIDPPGEALPDAEIFIRFAKAMGFKGFNYMHISEVYAEHCALTKGTNIDISGLSYDRLQKEGTFQWPVKSAQQNGTPRLFTDKRFYTPNQKAKFLAIEDPGNPSEPPTPDFPLILTTGRIRDQWHTMTKTGNVNKLKQHISEPFLEIHPDDAEARGISEGDNVMIYNGRGEVRVNARVVKNIKKGVVFLAMHWGKKDQNDFARANNLTSNLIDPVSKEPDFKYSIVEVAKFNKPREKVVVVGAGAAAYRFINTYRSINTRDEIHVFSKEKHPFYNRVLLPEYVSEHLSWEKLLKFKQGEFDKLDVTLHVENEISGIDRERKEIIDGHGNKHSYDKLILATGSRAFVPKDAPVDMPGVFTMRNKHNADDLKKHLHENAHVLIIGGGLLGLELAAALKEINIDISIVQLASRLMERQLDTMASDLLRDFVEEKDINIFINNQVESMHYEEEQRKIMARLKSGQVLNVDAVVFAIGTRPNIEFVKEAGIDYGRGIVVNDYLQTSDPDIFAMGEIAEHRGKLNGITAAAEQQADIAAKFINGDMSAIYSGSIPMNILKFSDLDLCSIGIPDMPANDRSYDEILFIDRSMRYYKKCIIKDDKLVGAILMGDKSEFAEFKSLIESEMELSEKRMQLLRSGQAAEPVIGKLVCSCNNVGRGNLENLIKNGCEEFNALCKQSGAGLGCGSCKPEVQEILSASKKPEPVLAME